MLSQETINIAVSAEVILGLAVIVILGAYFLYRQVEYQLFIRRASKKDKEKRNETHDNAAR